MFHEVSKFKKNIDLIWLMVTEIGRIIDDKVMKYFQ